MLSQNIFTEKLQYENRLTIFVSSFFIIMIINKDSIFVFLYLREKSKSFFISKFYKNRVRKILLDRSFFSLTILIIIII